REDPPFALRSPRRIRQCREGADRHDRWVGIGLDRPTSKPSRRALGRGFDDLAISDVEDAVSDGRNPSVVGDHDDGLLEISVQRLEQIQDFLAGLRVEFSRGLVREEQGRTVRQGNRDGDPLLLTAAHLVRPMARTVGEADEVEEFLRPSLPGRAVFGARRIGSSMFSSAESVGTRLKNWKTKPAWRNRYRTSSPSLMSTRLEPFTSIRPAVGRSIPPRMFKNVVLPHPEGPRIATSSPSWMCRSRPRKAMTSAFPVRYTLIKSLVR